MPLRSLYNQAWGRVAGMGSDTMGEFGVGLHEARHWHQRAYGGVVSLLIFQVDLT